MRISTGKVTEHAERLTNHATGILVVEFFVQGRIVARAASSAGPKDVSDDRPIKRNGAPLCTTMHIIGVGVANIGSHVFPMIETAGARGTIVQAKVDTSHGCGKAENNSGDMHLECWFQNGCY